MTFTRRPLLQGNTVVPTHTQPSIRGNVPKVVLTGDIPSFVAPLDLVLETEGMGGLPQTITLASATLSAIITAINAVLVAGVWGEASERDGCLVITTAGTGQDSFIRVLQASVNDDAAPILGLPQHPDPLGTVSGGDIFTAATRSRTEANAEGTRFLAGGEDRTSEAYNRALAQLSLNDDHLWVLAQTPVAVPMVIELDFGVTPARFNIDVNGNIDQIDLTLLESLDARWAGRLFVGGGLSNASTLTDIARSWRITDSEGKELLAWDSTWVEGRRAVRVSSVHRGLRVAAAPVFADEVSAPAGALLDTQDLTPIADGRNVLGVDRVKVLSAQIEVVVRNTGVRCLVAPGFGFVAEGAVVGDVAVIVGATVDVPINHNGTYLVETVTVEDELVLRPSSEDNLHFLNDAAGGTYGDVTISSGGEWEKEVFITLDPPLPRLPADGKLRIICGLERPLAVALVDQFAVPTIGSAPEVAAFVSQQLWNRQSLDGAYAGMAKSGGGGFYANVDTHPATFKHSGLATASEGTAGTTYTGDLVDGVLVALDPLATFVLSDVGKVVHLTGPVIYNEEEPFIIVEFIDGTHVRVVPGGGRMGATFVDEAGVDYTIYDDSRIDLPASLRALSVPDNSQSTGYGFVATREQTSAVSVGDVVEGRGFLHLERQRRAATVAGAPPTITNILTTAVTAYPGGATLTVGIDPEIADNIRAELGGSTKTVDGYRSATLVRILNGPSMGWYRLSTTTAAGVLSLLQLSGAAPVFVDPGFTVYLGFYNVTFGTNVPLAANVVAGAVVFGNGSHAGGTLTPALFVDWTGAGHGIYSVLNEPEFVSFDNQVGASGWHTYVKGYIPAHGARYDFTARDVGPDAERGVRTSLFIANSWFLDLGQMADPLVAVVDPDGWGGWFHQSGRDPALVVTRGPGVSGGAPGENPVTLYGVPAAALVVQAEVEGVPTSYMGGALDVLGFAFLRKGANGTGTAGTSSLQVEGTVAVGRTVWSPYQYLGVLDANSEYDPVEPIPRLGLPSRVVPVSAATAAILNATINVPNYTRFPDIPHHAVLSVANADMSTSTLTTDHLGAGVLLSAGADYRLAGFVVDAGVTYMALIVDVGGAVYAAAPAAVTFTLLGRRWSHGYVDTAAWMLVGTDIEATEYKLPWLTIGTDPDVVADFPVSAPGVGVLGTDTEGALSALDFAPSVEGKGVGNTWSSADLLTVMTTPALFAGLEGYVLNRFFGPWQTDTRQPRSPFPNEGVFAEDHASTTPGNLVTDDYAAEFVVGGADVRVEWHPNFGGCLRVDHLTGAGGANTICIWSRGVRELAPDLFGLRARALVWIGTGGVTRDVILSLRKDNGVVVATTTISVPGLATVPGMTEPFELEHVFSAETLLAGSANMLDLNTLNATGVHLCMTFPVNNADFGGTSGIFIITMGLDPVARPHRVSAMDVAGPLRFSTLRAISPVRGFETVGPQQADLLNSAEYAKLFEDDNGTAEGLVLNNEVGSQEGRGVGLVETAAGVWHQPVLDVAKFFQKSRHTASLTFHHPYFDPFWYIEGTRAVGPGVAQPASCVLPGRTGFIIPVNPPHGSRLTSLYHLSSIRPAYLLDGATVTDMQIWKEHPAKAALIGTWNDPTVWDAYQGYHVRLWRYNCLDFSQHMEELTTRFTGSENPSFGFAEPIYTGEVDLNDDAGAPAFADNANYSKEYFVKDRQDLYQGNTVYSAMLVDRRHYSYFVTLEMWGGCRSAAAGLYSYDTALEPMFVPQAVASVGLGALLPFQGYQVPVHPGGAPTAALTWPAVFKFRGLRLGWVTDRPGHGGWG